MGQDGTLYISDDQRGRIWRVTFHGAASAGLEPAPAPSEAPSSAAAERQPGPPEDIHRNAGNQETAALPTPPGAEPAEVALGQRIFHGQAAGATCAGCHGANAKGTPLGPDLTDARWLWGDGSLASIRQTIANGVAHPKQYRGVMPPKGGTDLSSSEVEAVAAYVWALSHRGANQALR
jgi:mono/diheme cytochrome c family protein